MQIWLCAPGTGHGAAVHQRLGVADDLRFASLLWYLMLTGLGGPALSKLGLMHLGSCIIFTAVLSVIVLRRRLNWLHLTGAQQSVTHLLFLALDIISRSFWLLEIAKPSQSQTKLNSSV